MKQESNSSPLKANNSTIKVLNSSEDEDIQTNFLKAMTKIINEFKDEMYKQLN
jgi:hypothetical protein